MDRTMIRAATIAIAFEIACAQAWGALAGEAGGPGRTVEPHADMTESMRPLNAQAYPLRAFLSPRS
jgi:hypothetical protein